MSTDKPRKLIGVKGENTQHLKVFEIDTGGAPAVKLEGKQASGKSSILRMIEWAIAGKGCLRKGEEIVKRGTGKAKGRLEFDDGTVIERSQTVAGTQSLVVTVSGKRLTGPKQDWLNTVFGDRPRDPLEFMHLKGKEQVDHLKAILGLDFTVLDRKREDLYYDRTRTGQDKTTAEAKLKDMPYYEDRPKDVISLSTLTQERDEKQQQQQQEWEKFQEEKHAAERKEEQRLALLNRIEGIDSEVETCEREISRLDERIEHYQQLIKEAEDEKKQQAAAIKQKHQERETVQRTLEREHYNPVPLTMFDEKAEELKERFRGAIALIDDKIASIEETNEEIRANRARREQAELVESLGRTYKEYTEQITAIDEQKAAEVARCKFPIPGISFGSDAAGQPCVLYNNMSLANVSQGEQLRVSTAIMIKQHAADFPSSGPIVEINQGSLLDSENRQMVVDMVAEAGGVVFLEVTTDDDELKIVIVEGEDGKMEEDNGAAASC